MSRIENERQVLATLLLTEYGYQDLPENFSMSDFETSDYRNVYEILLREFIEEGKPVQMDGFLSNHPALKPLIEDVTFAAIPTRQGLRGKASTLRNHHPQQHSKLDANELPNCFNHRENDRFQFELLNGQQIYQMEIPEQSFLVDNLISEHSVNFLAGEEGCGKSLIAMNMALCVAIGADAWLGYEIVKHGKVLYLLNEGGFDNFARRLKTMCEYLPARGDISNLIVPKEVPALNECWNTLNELCEREKPCLIVVDCLYFTHNKDENDSSDMKALMRQFLSLKDKHNLALLLIHHTKKGSQYNMMHNDQMRGSNIFGGVTDTVLMMRRSAADETKRIIKPTKFRHVSDENRKCRLLSLNPETLWFKDEGETDEGEHIATPNPTAEQKINWDEVFTEGEEFSRKEILDRCKPLGYDERTIDRILKNSALKGVLKKGSKYGYYAL